jgi:hypothetical protein
MAGAALVHGSEGTSLVQRKRGRENGRGMLLTTPGSCDGGLKSRIGGAEVKSRRCRGGSMAAQPSVRAMARRRKGSGKARGCRGGL